MAWKARKMASLWWIIIDDDDDDVGGDDHDNHNEVDDGDDGDGGCWKVGGRGLAAFSAVIRIMPKQSSLAVLLRDIELSRLFLKAYSASHFRRNIDKSKSSLTGKIR